MGRTCGVGEKEKARYLQRDTHRGDKGERAGFGRGGGGETDRGPMSREC